MYASTMNQSKTLHTSLGPIQFSVDAVPHSKSPCQIDIKLLDLKPALPPGMAVRRLRAVLLLASSPAGFARLEFRCTFQTAIEADPAAGEGLDAQSWSGPRDVVTIGTEDGEALQRRMAWLTPKGDPFALVQYRHAGLSIPLERVPLGATVGLHFVVAENANPEPVECSSWFAVDIQHARLRELAAQHVSP